MKKRKKKTLFCHVRKRAEKPVLKYSVPQEVVASAMDAARRFMAQDRAD